MRWKALFFDKCQQQYPISTHKQPQFINKKMPTTNPGYERIEKDIQTMIKSIKFRSSQNDFQKKLKEDIKLINSSKNIFLSADKTQNFYEIMKKNYEKIIHEHVTKKYKNAMSLPKRINREAKKIAKTFPVTDRLDIMAKQECFKH